MKAVSIMKKTLALVLSVVLVVGLFFSVSAFDVFATQSCSGSFNGGYTLTGDGFTDMVNIAMAQNERTQSQIGYTETWCADFVSDCARLAGQEAAIPFNGVVQSMYNAVISAGGYQVSSPQAGDLVFFYNSGYNYGHVGIALDGSRNISGNIWYNNQGPRTVKILYNKNEGFQSFVFVRPNYKRIVTDTTPPTISDIYTHSYDSNGYTLHFIVHDDTALSYVRVYTQGNVPQTSEDIAVGGTGWEFNYRVNYSDHGNVKNGYTHAIWVFDTAGNRGDSDWIYVPDGDTEPPTISDITVSQVTSKGYRVTCRVSDNVGVTGSSFPTWTTNNGQDDLIWHEGTISSNIATFYIKTSDHNNETGDYITHIYASDAAGNYSSVSTGVINVSDNPVEISSTVYEGHKYVVYNSGKSWTEAKQWCEQNGGYLATITSDTEWDQVSQLLKEYNGMRCWLGGESTSGIWKWVSGESFNFSLWEEGQPDNYDKIEFYLGTHGGDWLLDNYLWNDYTVDNDSVGGFVFEKDITPTVTKELNGHTYEYYSDTLDWWQAYRFCEKKGGHLVTITSKVENDFVADLLKEKITNGWVNVFTGGKLASGDKWVWITGESFDYQNWSADEPDISGNAVDSINLIITTNSSFQGKWNNNNSKNVSSVVGFVCEYENSIDASTYEPVYKENYNGHEYWFFEDVVDWRTAKKICEAKGGHLVVINDSSENGLVYSGMQKTTRNQMWIGITDIAEEGIWKDVNGNLLKYTNWHPVQPDNYNGCEDFGCMWDEGTWNDANSVNGVASDLGFVCEFDDLCTGSGHNYKITVVDPTCTSEGYTLHTCSKCGDSYKTDMTEKLSHEYGDWTVSGDKAVHSCKHCGAQETKPVASSVSLEKTTVTVEKGKTVKLNAVVAPEDAYDKTVIWSSTNDSIASVSGGVVTANGIGTAYIIAITTNGRSAMCEVRVTDKEVNTLKNNSWVNAEKVQIGDDIRVTGEAEGGSGGYKYAFYFKRSANSKWNKIGEEFGAKTYGITVPKAAADYDMKVIVKDSAGNTAQKIFKVTVVESLPLTNISLINTPTEISVGKTVTIAGRQVGGAKPFTYEFYFKRSANSKWNKLSYGSDKHTYAKFTPTTTAEYDLKAVVIDSKGTKAEKIYKITAK